jgi:hypothetical protein
MKRSTLLRTIFAALFVATSVLSAGPARAVNAKDITLVLSNRTDANVKLVFRTLTGKNEPEFAIERGATLTFTFEGQYQMGGTVLVAGKPYIQPREIRLTRGNTQTMSLERDRTEGTYYFR